MAINEQIIERFLSANQLRQEIASVFRREGLQIARVIDKEQGSRWGLYIKLTNRHRRLFATSRELLVWVVQASEFQARTVTQANEIITQARPRLNEDFAIILTHDPETARHVNEAADSYSTLFIGFQIQEFVRRFGGQAGARLVPALQQRVYSRDLYDLPTAATSSDDFFGRRGLVAEVSGTLRMGSRHVGLFGLRKIGKTSFLYRLRSTLSKTGVAYVAHLDIERVDAVNPGLDYLIWSLGEAIWDAHHDIRTTKVQCRLLGRFQLFFDVPSDLPLVELFEHDVRAVLESLKRPLVVMLDEIELLSPLAKDSQWGSTFVRFWRLLRGMDQQSPGKLSFLVAGTNPAAFEKSQFDEVDNPAYNYLSIKFLGPLPRAESDDLLKVTGERTGLLWSEGALNRTFEVTGGHPALVRAFGSLVHKRRSPASTQWSVDENVVAEVAQRFLVERSALVSQILAVLEANYKDEYYLLGLLASGRVNEFREWAKDYPDDVGHLIGYGLCADPSTATSLSIDIVQSYLQRLSQGKSSRQIEPHRLSPGDKVGDYEIEGTIGRRGGFATVYRARGATPDSGVFAVKVFEGGSLAALQREVEPLSVIDHPNIVRMLDYGKDGADHVFLAMEYLDGDTMQSRCSRATRAGVDEVAGWLHSLAEALQAIHPDSRIIDSLRGSDEIGSDDLARMLGARHGFIHRDIKPENVVLTARGPVLIDFNISVQASSPARTVSATPGYLPPDRNQISWDPDVDLYQLGLTLTQAFLGLSLDNCPADEMRTVLSERSSESLAGLLLAMTSPLRKDRFGSASDLAIAADAL